jgi:hypothetical protein
MPKVFAYKILFLKQILQKIYQDDKLKETGKTSLKKG